MAKEINHWCVLCVKGYHACDSCQDVRLFTPWRALTDSIDHFKIFMTLKDYNNGFVSKDEAREFLSQVNISDKDTYKESSRRLINEILRDDNSSRKNSKKKTESENKVDDTRESNTNDSKSDSVETVKTGESDKKDSIEQ